jgi:uncharacterized protein (DUF362 family)
MASPRLGNNRRDFLKTSLASGAAALFAPRFARATERGAGPETPVASPPPAATATTPCKVALTKGDNRTDNVFQALKSLEKEIVSAIGKRRVIIKPNNVSATNQLASTHVDALIGILEFLKSVGKIENTIIAESAMSPTMQAFENLGYMPLADKYNIKLVDLDQEKYQTIMAFDETDAMAHPVRVSSMLTNQVDNFIISACMLKTHDRAVATLSIKNIILGAPLKFATSNTGNTGSGGRGGFGGRGGRGGRGGGRGFGGMFGGSDKPILHGGGAHGICVNLAMLAPLLHPSLSVIDGFEGMEGNGPIGGTPVEHRVCVVSTDYLAADTVGASLMGIDPGDIGYLHYLATAKAGESDLGKMEIIGEPVATLTKKYQLGRSIQQQLRWKEAARVTPS